MYQCDIQGDSLGDMLDRYITAAQVIGLRGTFTTTTTVDGMGNEEQRNPAFFSRTILHQLPFAPQTVV